ncbi:MAG: hypothetical protein KY432_08290, partial [Acidobacteria bacterium]|nr:hypothetical protein [Acidobacteriota bacterium]
MIGDRPRIAWLILTVLFGSMSSASAATFIVPEDEVLIDRAEFIFTGTVLSSTPRRTSDGGIETVYGVAVDEVLKGEVEGFVELREWGGMLDGEWMVASGTPHYETGARYLLFVTRFRDDSLTTLELSLGQFRFREVAGQSLLVRNLGDSSILGDHGNASRIATQFLSRIRDRVATHGTSSAAAAGLVPQANDLDTKGAAGKGASQWNSGSTVSYLISSTPASGNTTGNDLEDRIIVDDPNAVIQGTFSGSGTIATAFFGGTTGGFTDRINLTYSDIVVQDGVSSATGVTQEEYATVLTHELGHTLGFRHSNQNKFSDSGSTCGAPLPCSNTAVMNSFILSGLNGVLQSWDKAGVTSNYGSSPNADYLIVDQGSLRPWYRTNASVIWRISGGGSCSGPAITSGPVASPTAIVPGESAQLSVSATASQGSLQFQWYRGVSGNTGAPIPGGTVNTISVSPAQTTSYWVRITDSCGSTDSPAVQVTVALCEPVITSPPKGKVIGPGETTTLTVGATNANTYHWYQGQSGNTTRPAGTGSILTVAPSQTTSYWVRVGNSCGFVDSDPVTVQVLQCPPPLIVQQPADIDLQTAEKATLQVVASGTGELAYQWYRGASGDTSNPLPETSSVLVIDNVVADIDIWVRVSDECGFRDSRAARVRIVTVCNPPRIVTEPDDVTIWSGERALLQVGATGTSLIYQWSYRGGAVVIDVKGATGPTHETEILERDRDYFVRVRNNCGTVQSRDVKVEVTECTPPVIISRTPDQELSLGSTMDIEVVTAGTEPMDFQWYEGSAGDTSQPID